jgi:hypothetical protein
MAKIWIKRNEEWGDSIGLAAIQAATQNPMKEDALVTSSTISLSQLSKKNSYLASAVVR